MGAATRWCAMQVFGSGSAAAFFVPLVVCVLVGSGLPLAVEVAVLSALVAAIGWAATAPAGLVAVGASVLSLNGFRENGLGVLALHPRVDVPVAVTLLCAWALAWAAGEASRGRVSRP